MEKPGNVYLEGVYQSLSDLPLEECDLWLYTSEWDGVPNMLIEIASTGVPIVGSLVGGTGEILIEGLSHPIADINDLAAYEGAIRLVLADPDAAREGARKLREHVIETRTFDQFRHQVAHALSIGGDHGPH